MSDGIIAISRMGEETKESEKEKATEVAIAKRVKSRAFSDFILTDYGISEGGSTRKSKLVLLLISVRCSLPQERFSVSLYQLFKSLFQIISSESFLVVTISNK